ncbi:MAG: phosphoribosylanthranilate isomerase, partial [Pseudomonadota bacterium]
MDIKICCIQSVAEAEMALAAEATALGLVAAMPSGPGPIPDTQIAEIAASMVGRCETVLLT